MHKSLVRAALVAASAAVVAIPTAASAESLTIKDATHDVWKSTFDPETEEETVEPAGTQLNVDLARTVIKHTGRKVVVKATFVELKRTDNRYYFSTRIRTNEGIKREVGVETFSRQGWGGDAFLMKPNATEVRCRGLAHAIDYAANTVTVTLPRTCLSQPKWLQVTVGAFAFGENSQEFAAYVDNGHDETADEPKTWSKRIHRG